MMFFLKNFKIAVSVYFIACVLNYQVYAQVQTGLMKCNDITRSINFSVHFKGGEVMLLLKGYTYRAPYTESFVSSRGDRWSVYTNNEIRVLTTLPYDKYVAIRTVPDFHEVASTYCE